MKTSETFMTILVGQVGNLQADCQSAFRFAQWARP
jgi:hypothetical protein